MLTVLTRRRLVHEHLNHLIGCSGISAYVG